MNDCLLAVIEGREPVQAAKNRDRDGIAKMWSHLTNKIGRDGSNPDTVDEVIYVFMYRCTYGLEVTPDKKRNVPVN